MSVCTIHMHICTSFKTFKRLERSEHRWRYSKEFHQTWISYTISTDFDQYAWNTTKAHFWVGSAQNRTKNIHKQINAELFLLISERATPFWYAPKEKIEYSSRPSRELVWDVPKTWLLLWKISREIIFVSFLGLINVVFIVLSLLCY